MCSHIRSFIDSIIQLVLADFHSSIPFFTHSVTPSLHQVRHGMAQWSDGREKPQPIKLVLTEDTLTLQREEMVYTQADSEQVDQNLLSKVRSGGDGEGGVWLVQSG